jgi:hypothetical protein
MKRKILFSITILCFCISSVSGQGNATDSVKKSWSLADRTEFISACVNTAKTSMGTDSARYYCYCMQSKVEAKFSDPREADKLTAADFNTVEWQKEIKACLSGGVWTKKEREEFISSCINSAKENGQTETKAKNYCECTQFKVEKRYPNTTDLDKITEEELKSDFWAKLMASCLDN